MNNVVDSLNFLFIKKSKNCFPEKILIQKSVNNTKTSTVSNKILIFSYNSKINNLPIKLISHQNTKFKLSPNWECYIEKEMMAYCIKPIAAIATILRLQMSQIALDGVRFYQNASVFMMSQLFLNRVFPCNVSYHEWKVGTYTWSYVLSVSSWWWQTG